MQGVKGHRGQVRVIGRDRREVERPVYEHTSLRGALPLSSELGRWTVFSTIYVCNLRAAAEQPEFGCWAPG